MKSPIPTTATPSFNVNVVDKPLAAIDKKIIDKPSKYDGSIAKFPDWQDSFIDYVGTHDDRWRAVLDCISVRKSPITEQEMLNIAIEAQVGSQAIEFSKQLHTSGEKKSSRCGGKCPRLVGPGVRSTCSLSETDATTRRGPAP